MDRAADVDAPTNGHLSAKDFDRFYIEYFPRVRAYVRKFHPGFSADDVAQETLARAWRDRDHINPNRPVASYLLTVARSIVRDIARGQRMEAEARFHRLEPTEGERPEEHALINEEHRLVRRAVDALDQDNRDVLILTEWVGLDGVELAQCLGITHPAARKRLSRALERFRANFERLNKALLPALAGLIELVRALRRHLTTTVSVAGTAGVIAFAVGAGAGGGADAGADIPAPDQVAGPRIAALQPSTAVLPPDHSKTATQTTKPHQSAPSRAEVPPPPTRRGPPAADDPTRPRTELTMTPGTGPGGKEAHTIKVPVALDNTLVVEGDTHADGPASLGSLCDTTTDCVELGTVTTERTP